MKPFTITTSQIERTTSLICSIGDGSVGWMWSRIADTFAAADGPSGSRP